MTSGLDAFVALPMIPGLSLGGRESANIPPLVIPSEESLRTSLPLSFRAKRACERSRGILLLMKNKSKIPRLLPNDRRSVVNSYTPWPRGGQTWAIISGATRPVTGNRLRGRGFFGSSILPRAAAAAAVRSALAASLLGFVRTPTVCRSPLMGFHAALAPCIAS